MLWVVRVARITSRSTSPPIGHRGVEVEIGEFVYRARAVHDEVELHGLGLAGSFHADLVTASGLSIGDRGGAPQLDPGVDASADQELDDSGSNALSG